jgi:hypothetical protein
VAVCQDYVAVCPDNVAVCLDNVAVWLDNVAVSCMVDAILNLNYYSLTINDTY